MTTTDWWQSASSEDWSPRGGVDPTTPSTARMYDYYLGGKDNFAADREAAERALTLNGGNRYFALANRGFLVAAVRQAASAGVDQFLDLGTGIPTSPNVHEIARETHPAARVAYVDHDPIVTAHNRALRAVDANIGVIEGDIRDPATILEHPEVRRVIDFDKPVGVLAVAVLHFVTDAEDPAGILAALGEALPSGSYLALSAGTTDGLTDAEVAQANEVYANATSPLSLRSPDEIRAHFSGWELLESGLASAARWCDDPALDTRAKTLAGIAYKP